MLLRSLAPSLCFLVAITQAADLTGKCQMRALCFVYLPNSAAVLVGVDGPTFSPPNTQARIGDTVTFQFYPGSDGSNHTIWQSSFEAPCEPFYNATDSTAGFQSPWMRVKKDAPTLPTIVLKGEFL